MATYLELQTDVINLINRSDCTTALAKTFLQQAQRKIQRNLRIQSMEKSYQITAGTSGSSIYDATNGKIVIPGDFLELVYIYTDNDLLQRVPLNRFIELNTSATSTRPKYWTRIANHFHLKPVPSTGTIITVAYHSEDTVLSADSDTNILSAIAQDLLVYGALTYAAVYFNDQRQQLFEAKYQQIYNDVENLIMTSDQVGADGAIQPNMYFEKDLLN